MLTTDSVLDWDLADPVLGLEDVALGRWVCCPTTYYKLRNRDRSGVMGVVNQHGDLIMRDRSTTGQTLRGVDDDGVVFEKEIVWDGGQPSPVSEEPLGWEDLDEHETKPIFHEHSKGLLLGDYKIEFDGWADTDEALVSETQPGLVPAHLLVLQRDADR